MKPKTTWWAMWLKKPKGTGWFLDRTAGRPSLALTRREMREYAANYRKGGWQARIVKVEIPERREPRREPGRIYYSD